MSLQTSISEYFNNRKRQAGEEAKRATANKVLILDEGSLNDVSAGPRDVGQQKVVFVQREDTPKAKQASGGVPQQPRKTPKSASASRSKRAGERSKQSDIRKSLFPSIQKESKNDEEVKRKAETTVAEFKAGGCLSPMKTARKEDATPETESDRRPPAPVQEETVEVPAVPSTSKVLDKLSSIRRDLGFGEVKARLTRSSRLDEIRNALGRFKEGHDKLGSVQTQPSGGSPTLKQFTKIELEVPTSPAKLMAEMAKSAKSPVKLREALLRTPSKATPVPYTSPRKLFEEHPPSPLKSPAFQRYSSLASADRSTLVLPYKYRALAEVFRSVDTVASIMFNRNEVVPFPKLKQSVQELNKKNLLESHLGQIKTVLPNAFKFSQEKVRGFGNRSDKYELLVTPVIENKGTQTCCEGLNRFTTTVFLQRKRAFYEALMEKAKSHHEEFLRRLVPPMEVSRDKLTRWHPEFDVDSCPDIAASPLPRAPNTEKCSSARDVLLKAKDMFMVNHRMEKVLQNLSDSQPVVVNAAPTAASHAIPALANALKGIPKSLLEKVRARQAAKALELLTRKPEDNKAGTELSRLPELARILRNLFVGEKKNALPYEIVIEKLCSSYREILTSGEMEHHLSLLMAGVPTWLTVHTVQKTKFVKMAKDMEVAAIMATLQAAADLKNK